MKNFKWTPPKIDEPPLTGRQKVGHFLFGFVIVIILLAIWLFFSWFDYRLLQKIASVSSYPLGDGKGGLPLSLLVLGLPLVVWLMIKKEGILSPFFPLTKEGRKRSICTVYKSVLNLLIGKKFTKESDTYRVYGFRVFLLTAIIVYCLYTYRVIDL